MTVSAFDNSQISGNQGTNANQGGQIANESGQNANQNGQIAEHYGENNINKPKESNGFDSDKSLGNTNLKNNKKERRKLSTELLMMLPKSFADTKKLTNNATSED